MRAQDLIQFAIGRFNIAIQHICNEGQAAPGMIEGDDRIGKKIDAIRDLRRASCGTLRAGSKKRTASYPR